MSYVGDARLGRGVNVGAGTITCNYDGANKHRTEINDDAFIGSNTALVAPVSVGKGATVGAGSTIDRDVSDNTLAVERSRMISKADWKRPDKRRMIEEKFYVRHRRRRGATQCARHPARGAQAPGVSRL